MPVSRILAAAALVTSLVAAPVSAQESGIPDQTFDGNPTRDQVREAARSIGLEYSDAELALLMGEFSQNLAHLRSLRARELDNGVAPATGFTPLIAGVSARLGEVDGEPHPVPDVQRPDDLRDLHFADIDTLSALVRAREVSCVELTELFLARLREVDDVLHCVISYTDERALAQARALDAELADGRWRGPLHGIPWGAKDLLATRDGRTTWGAKPFEDQVLDLDATVVRKLDEAGAVLVAKLTLGALAWGDVWYGERTRNPWNPEQGSSGSSAGPASAVAAGALPFAMGSETLGSIISPSARCGNSSLRPTFGRVSRHGAMALSWTMDKLGPMCRSLRDASLVMAAIDGVDPLDDFTVETVPFAAPPRVDPSTIRVGIVESAFRGNDGAVPVIEQLAELGVPLTTVELPEYPLSSLLIILSCEAAEAFNELTVDGRDDELVRQVEQAWPNVFRAARLVPAVEYLRAQRLRRQLMLSMDTVLADVDVLVHPADDFVTLAITNLTGHPTAVAPCGFREDGTPFPIGFTGQLFDDARLMALAEAWQRSTEHHLRRPELD